MIKKLISLGVTILLLTACSHSLLNNKARCPFIDRGGCQSMEMVNKMVDERRFTPDGLFVQQACLAPAPCKKTTKKEIYK